MARGQTEGNSQDAPLREASGVLSYKQRFDHLKQDLPEKKDLFSTHLRREQPLDGNSKKQLNQILGIGQLVYDRAEQIKQPYLAHMKSLQAKIQEIQEAADAAREVSKNAREAYKDLSEDHPDYEAKKAFSKEKSDERMEWGRNLGKAKEALSQYEATLHKASLLKALGEVRALGYERHEFNNPVIKEEDEFSEDNEFLARIVEGATSVYPASWVKMARFGVRLGPEGLYLKWEDYEKKNKQGGYQKLTLDDGAKFGVLSLSQKFLDHRGSYKHTHKELKSAAVHEYGHHMEVLFPHLHRAQEAYLAKRLQEEKPFEESYVLTDYGQDVSHAEVFTVGMGSLFSGSISHYKKIKEDKEYQSFILGLLAAT